MATWTAHSQTHIAAHDISRHPKILSELTYGIQPLAQEPSSAKYGKGLNQVEAIFSLLIECRTEERNTCLERLCADNTELRLEVESLLFAADKASGFLSIAPEAVEQVFADRLEPESLLGQLFGPYRLLSVLERGGMGVVFLAERADGHYDQQVAVKLANHQISASSLMERFNRERQILANIRHPNVARLLDGGTSGAGYPYIVMEYITGQSIDLYCQENALAPRQILELFLIVCETVQHAQQNLVVHCDLKPDNILVTADGIPKLLDFGIAQLLDPIRNQTREATAPALLGPMTPEFAAPEQLLGEQITTATDVYALGNILHRLLTGVGPQPSRMPQRNEISAGNSILDIARPSSVAPRQHCKQLRGDIDNIVLRAMSQDPAARYSTAQLLADDIRFFLTRQAVTASNPTPSYRAVKFLHRHRLGAVLASLSIVLMLLGVTATTIQSQIARSEREVAESRLSEVRELANTIVFDLPKTIGALAGSTPLRERLLSRGTAYLDRLSTEQQDSGLMEDLAGAYHELATVQGNPLMANLGDPRTALKHYRKSIAMREALLDQDSANMRIRTDLAASYSMMSAIYGGTLEDTAQARAVTHRCLDLLRPYTASGDPALVSRWLSCLTIAAHWASVDADYELAASLLKQADRLLAGLPDNSDLLLPDKVLRLRGRVHEEWAQIHAETGRLTQAVTHERRRLSLWSRITDGKGVPCRRLGTANHGLAARLAAAGNEVEALAVYHRALRHWQDWRSRYPADDSATQAIAIVQAEMADLHWRKHAAEAQTLSLANHPERNRSIHRHSHSRDMACSHYQSSVTALGEVISRSSHLVLRYSWSPTATQIRQQHAARCNKSV